MTDTNISDDGEEPASVVSLANLLRLGTLIFEAVAIGWVIFYYHFEPVIPVYQGY